MERTHTLPLFDETTAWLLESQTPSIRYLTLTQLLGKPETDVEVQAARRMISDSPPGKKILDAQNEDGSWVNPRHIYSPKYRSSHWTMLLLTELAVDPQEEGMRRGSDFMQTWVQGNMPQYLRRTEAGFGCFWGNWLRYQLYCGKSDDPFTQQVIDFVCDDLERHGRCRYNSDLDCAWSVARGLYGFAFLPEIKRSDRVSHAIQTGIHFLLEEHDLLKADYPTNGQPHELWHKLSFPIFYHSDRLFILRVLKEHQSLDHPKAKPALDWLAEKRGKNGRWHGGSPFASRTRPFLEKPDSVDHWLTLQALDVLSFKQFNG
jgi:hypothetical protein